MGTNPLAAWIAGLAETATIWEVAAALFGIFAVGYSLWGIADNVFDIRAVRKRKIDGDPRGIAAWFLLAANVLFLLGWLGYTHVATTAVYLPARPDVDPGALSEVAVMRLGYGFFGLLAQAVLRWMRLYLRGLSREQWAPLIGESAHYEALWHDAQSRALKAEAEVLNQRARAHSALNREAGHVLRIGVLERLLRQHDIAYPPRVVLDDAPSAEKE